MIEPAIPVDEAARLSALRSLNILDTVPEERFDRLTRMARRMFGVPIALISLVDENRQWFKSCQGLSVSENPRNISFCGHAILDDEILVVPNALADERFHDNPLVRDEPRIVPPRGRIPRTCSTPSGITSASIGPRQPSRNPTNSWP